MLFNNELIITLTVEYIEDVLQKFAEGQEGAAPVESPTAKKAA